MKAFVVGVLLMVSARTMFSQPGPPKEWLTYYELSGCKKTPRYAETVEYCKRLAKASPWVKYTTFGISPQGREMPLVILSRDKAFDPVKAARSGKATLLIQSGIHAGEIDGKDASLMLMRDIAITKTYAGLLDHVILLFVPIFNVDGHERYGPYNRINQNGPEETGWRVTAQNLNLNRDYMKADTPEMQSMLRLFTAWLPDFFVDCHVTDGIDFQYDVTYVSETARNIEPVVGAWVKEHLLPEVLPKVEASGHKIFMYVAPREDEDLAKGLRGGAIAPRLSTGYSAIQNRPNLLVETHSLKPYSIRVDATYHLLRAVIETVNRDAQRLRTVVRRADELTIMAGSSYDPYKAFALRLGVGEKSETRRFLGVTSTIEPSEISGTHRRIYSAEPMELKVPYYNEVTVADSVSIPLGYLVPQEWKFVPAIMRLHGIKMEQLLQPAIVEIESYRFSDVRWRDRPYEGRHGAAYDLEMVTEQRAYPTGTFLIRTNQRAAKVVVHLLEPKSSDSFVAWGFFNAIFEQKEYAESYVMETEGRKMLVEDASLRNEFYAKVAVDTVFAKDPGARLNWLYLRSRWADPWLNKYPVGRVVTNVRFTTKPVQ